MFESLITKINHYKINISVVLYLHNIQLSPIFSIEKVRMKSGKCAK